LLVTAFLIAGHQNRIWQFIMCIWLVQMVALSL
jgi:hypothetical protein